MNDANDFILICITESINIRNDKNAFVTSMQIVSQMTRTHSIRMYHASMYEIVS